MSVVLHREAVRVTWSALRGRALWPGWQEVEEGELVTPAVEAAGRIWAALLKRGEVAGFSFGCGTYRDEEGQEREAACRITSARILAYPGPLDGDTGEITARVEYEAETRHGPNSFALGAELARRLTGAQWQYAPNGVAGMTVTRVETYAPQNGWVAIYPARPAVL